MTIQELLNHRGKIAVLISNEEQWNKLKKLGFNMTSKYYGDKEDCYTNQAVRASQGYYEREGTPVVKFEDIQFEQNYKIY